MMPSQGMAPRPPSPAEVDAVLSDLFARAGAAFADEDTDGSLALAQIDGGVVLDGPDVDPAKVILPRAGTGVDGIEAERDLLTRGMALEIADRDTLIATITYADGRPRWRCWSRP